MADAGRTWLVRRAERLYGDRLGRLRHSGLSWHIAWKWLPALVVVGFVYGTIMQFTGRPSSQRGPALFSDIPLFLVTSILTGLVLWSVTLFWSFRRVLVFDRGLLYGYAQKNTARAIFWPDLDAADGAVSGAAKPGFFTFSTARVPERLVSEIQQARVESGIQRPGSPGLQALPPVQISSATRLDRA